MARARPQLGHQVTAQRPLEAGREAGTSLPLDCEVAIGGQYLAEVVPALSVLTPKHGGPVTLIRD